MPDIPDGPSTKKRISLNDKDGDQDPDGDSSSGSPPPSKQSKQDPDTERGSNNDNRHSENGDHSSENGFQDDDSGGFRQNSMKIKPINNKSKASTSKNSFSNFSMPISPPHEVEFDGDEDEYDDIPSALLEPETTIEDGQDMPDELMGAFEDNDESELSMEESNGASKLNISSVKDNQKLNPKSSKITSMKFGQIHKPGSSDDVQSKTEKLKIKSAKRAKQSGIKNVSQSRSGGLLTGQENEPLSIAEFEVKQEVLGMDESNSLPIEEREIKQETMEEEMRQAFDYYGKNAAGIGPPGMNLPLPPNLPLPLGFPPFGGLGMFGFNQALFNGHKNSFLPPPAPMPPAPGMVIKAGKWVDPSQIKKSSKDGGASSSKPKVHKHHFTPHTITGKVMDRTLQTLTEPEGEHKCDYCGNIYNKRASLESHIKRNHNPNLTVKCPECPKMLSCQAAIKKHLLTHRPESEWPYICEFCGKRFQAKGDLPKHFVTSQHRDDPRVPKPGTPEWQIVLDRSAVAGSSFAPKPNEGKGKKKKKKDSSSNSKNELPFDDPLDGVDPINQALPPIDPKINNPFPFSLPHPDTLPKIKDEPDAEGEIPSNLLYPEISLDSTSKHHLPMNKINKHKKASAKGKAKIKNEFDPGTSNPFMGLPMPNDMAQNPFLMAFMMNQMNHSILGMNKPTQSQQTKQSGKKGTKKDALLEPKSSSSKTVNTQGSDELSPHKEYKREKDADDSVNSKLNGKENEKKNELDRSEIKTEVQSVLNSNEMNTNEKHSKDTKDQTNSKPEVSNDLKTDPNHDNIPPSSSVTNQSQENSSKVFQDDYQDPNTDSSKPLPSFKSVHDKQHEINDDHPPPTPGFNIMDILEEEPIMPSTSDQSSSTCPAFDSINGNNNLIHNNMNQDSNDPNNPQIGQQMNGQLIPGQSNQSSANINQSIQGQSQQHSNQNFSNELAAQQASQQCNPMQRLNGGAQPANSQMAHQMNQLGQANMNQWGGGQMDPAAMAYWYNTNGGNGATTAANMPYWWNGGGGSGGGGMPPPVL